MRSSVVFSRSLILMRNMESNLDFSKTIGDEHISQILYCSGDLCALEGRGELLSAVVKQQAQ